jgi:hypothetical protein
MQAALCQQPPASHTSQVGVHDQECVISLKLPSSCRKFETFRQHEAVNNLARAGISHTDPKLLAFNHSNLINPLKVNFLASPPRTRASKAVATAQSC